MSSSALPPQQAIYFVQTVARKLRSKRNESKVVDIFSAIVANMEKGALRKEIEKNLEHYFEVFSTNLQLKEEAVLATAEGLEYPLGDCAVLLSDLATGHSAYPSYVALFSQNFAMDVELQNILEQFVVLNHPLPQPRSLSPSMLNMEFSRCLLQKLLSRDFTKARPCKNNLISFVLGFLSLYYGGSLLMHVSLFKKNEWSAVAYGAYWHRLNMEKESASISDADKWYDYLSKLLSKLLQHSVTEISHVDDALMSLLIAYSCCKAATNRFANSSAASLLCKHLSRKFKSLVKLQQRVGWSGGIMDIMEINSVATVSGVDARKYAQLRDSARLRESSGDCGQFLEWFCDSDVLMQCLMAHYSSLAYEDTGRGDASGLGPSAASVVMRGDVGGNNKNDDAVAPVTNDDAADMDHGDDDDDVSFDGGFKLDYGGRSVLHGSGKRQQSSVLDSMPEEDPIPANADEPIGESAHEVLESQPASSSEMRSGKRRKGEKNRK
jgi:hypothetical protein